VVICGHSRGGPIASIVACLIYEKLYIDNIELTTFGSPRFTTDESFKDYKFIRESCRVVFSGDVITKMPKRCFCNFKIKKMIELGREYILGEEKDRHAGKILDNYDAHQISMYKSICYDMERKT